MVPGAGCWCWCCELAVHVVETDCWCWCWGWLCTWWRQVAGAGAGRRCCPGACAGAVSGLRVVETGCWCWRWVPVLVLSRAVLFARILLYVHCSMRNVRLSTNHCFSMFQPATHKRVVLDTAWPWGSEAYRLCPLCALFCAHKLTRAKSYGFIVLQIFFAGQGWDETLFYTGQGPAVLSPRWWMRAGGWEWAHRLCKKSRAHRSAGRVRPRSWRRTRAASGGCLRRIAWLLRPREPSISKSKRW